MDEMIAWLRAVLDGLEAAAQAASPVPDTQTPDEGGTADHHALHGPSAVLARIEAERRIVAAYERAEQLARKTNEPQIERDAAMIWQAASWLAYGHRFDGAGWQAEWAPLSD